MVAHPSTAESSIKVFRPVLENESYHSCRKFIGNASVTYASVPMEFS